VTKLNQLAAWLAAFAACGAPAVASARALPRAHPAIFAAAAPGRSMVPAVPLPAFRSQAVEQQPILLARMTPDQRAQFQQQMADMRNRRAEHDAAANAANPAHPRLSPEERRQLREQIRDAHRDWNGTRPPPPRGDR
jgi:hypothetical protein